MKARYVGESFGVDGLTNQRVYNILEVDDLTGALRVVDDSGEDYLYSPTAPGPIAGKYRGGKWEIVEDKDNQLKKVIL